MTIWKRICLPLGQKCAKWHSSYEMLITGACEFAEGKMGRLDKGMRRAVRLKDKTKGVGETMNEQSAKTKI